MIHATPTLRRHAAALLPGATATLACPGAMSQPARPSGRRAGSHYTNVVMVSDRERITD